MTRQDRRIARAMRWVQVRPWLLWLVVGALAVFAATGLARLRFDDELIRFFDSDIAAYKDYVSLSRAFEGDTNDVIVLVEAGDVAAPELAGALSDFVLDAQFVPGVRAVISPLSLKLDGPTGSEPLFPYPPLAAPAMAARLEAAWAGLPALSGLMARDRTALVVVLPITEAGGEGGVTRRAQVAEITALGDRLAEASGAEVRLSGYPVLRDSVARALVRDTVVLNAIGLFVGFVIAVATFKSVWLALLSLPGPVMAVGLTLGLHGHLGVAINSITLALPVLVLVLGASDAVHIGFERARQGRRAPAAAAMRAVRRVAVACLFAAVTTAIAFAALTFSRSAIIAEMGRMGMVVTIASALSVLVTQAAVLATAGRFGWFQPLYDRLHGAPPSVLGLERLPALAFAAPRRAAWGALALLALATALYAQAGPRYSLMDSLHARSPVRAVFDRVEAKVAPVSQIQVPLGTTDPIAVALVAEVVAREAGARAVQSIAGIDGGAAAAETALPEAIARRLVSEDGTQTLVSAAFRYVNGEETLALADRLDAALAAEPGLAGVEVGRVTGLPVMSARVASVVLDEINRSLLVALAGVALLIYLWLGSLRVALISLVPNMLPVTLIGAFLMLSGGGIQFSNALALTVAFGIAVDDSLHVLNRLKLTGGVRDLTQARLRAALDEVAPALVTTSTVLVLGMGGALFAENKGVTDFGKIAMSVYMLALVADLVVLPAVLARFGPGAYLRAKTEGR